MTAVVEPATRPTYAAGCVVGTEPPITISKRETALPLGLGSFVPVRFAHAPFVRFPVTWRKQAEVFAALDAGRQ